MFEARLYANPGLEEILIFIYLPSTKDFSQDLRKNKFVIYNLTNVWQTLLKRDMNSN